MKALPALLTAALLLAAAPVTVGQPPAADADPLKAERDLAMVLRAVTAEYEAGEYAAAMARLDALPAPAAADPAALNMRGALLTKLQRYDDARAVFAGILEKDPEYFPAVFNMGELLFLQGQYNEALEYFRTMSRRDPRNELIRFKLVLCYLLLDRVPEAEKVARTFMAAGNTPAYYYAMAMLARKAGNTSADRDHLEAARHLYPKNQYRLFEETIAPIRF